MHLIELALDSINLLKKISIYYSTFSDNEVSLDQNVPYWGVGTWGGILGLGLRVVEETKRRYITISIRPNTNLLIKASLIYF